MLPIAVSQVRTSSDPEALYRAMMTLGNLLTIGKKVVQEAKENYDAKKVVAEAVSRIDKNKEKRTVDIGVEIELLLAGN